MEPAMNDEPFPFGHWYRLAARGTAGNSFPKRFPSEQISTSISTN